MPRPACFPHFPSINTMFAIIELGILCLGFPIAVALFAFWIWMLVDCLTKESSEGNDKLVWTLVIVFLHALGAVIYWFGRRPERQRLLGR